MTRLHAGSCTLLLVFCPFGVGQNTVCPNKIPTANAWLAIAGMTSNIKDLATVCKEALRLSVDDKDVANACAGSPKNEDPPDPRVDLTLPSWRERVLRTPQFKAEFLRTPNYVFGIPEGSPPGTQAQIFSNPDHGLLSVGGALDFGELFPDAGKTMTACEARMSLLGEGKENMLPGKCDESPYLNATRKGEWARRYASATVINVNVSQVPRFESGIILSPVLPSNDLRWSYSVTGSISPAALFESAAQRKQYGDYYTKHRAVLTSLDPGGSLQIEDSCRGTAMSQTRL
jgi:hypothetical protein